MLQLYFGVFCIGKKDHIKKKRNPAGVLGPGLAVLCLTLGEDCPPPQLLDWVAVTVCSVSQNLNKELILCDFVFLMVGV